MKIKSSFLLLSLLVIIILVSIVNAFAISNYYHLFLCFYSLLLLIIPSLVIKKLRINVSDFLLILYYASVFSSNILGEVYHFYVNTSYFDVFVHFLTGFFMASLFFTLIKNFTPLKKNHLLISAISVSLSLTFSVGWELFEYSCDKLLLTDMQQDTLISNISSLNLDKSESYKPVKVEDIHKIILYNANNDILKIIEGGYLDIGLNDTMSDLLIAFIGAFISSVFSYLYFKFSNHNNLLVINKMS
ncbi:MAG: DUF2238 domain-containing protein [Ruminococcus sp.]|nr:DUF2238 domain-containing protein [Ruminococcus sp.]